ncbi:hypothetical protein EDD96_6014 [Streptomyces sp. Ag109_G2-6]|nr:hypothetical protein EDD96_6014 [Streptomyces sp. Ag109_G2-6]
MGFRAPGPVRHLRGPLRGPLRRQLTSAGPAREFGGRGAGRDGQAELGAGRVDRRDLLRARRPPVAELAHLLRGGQQPGVRRVPGRGEPGEAGRRAGQGGPVGVPVAERQRGHGGLRLRGGQVRGAGGAGDEQQDPAVGGEEPARVAAYGQVRGDGAGVPGAVLRDAAGAQDPEPVEGGGGGGAAVLQQGGPGAVDPGPEGGQGAAGVARLHQGGQVGGLGEVDAGDLLGGQPDGRDPVGAPGAAVVHVQDLAGEARLGREAGGTGGDPVHGEPARVAPLDPQLLAHLAGGGRRGGLPRVHRATGQQPVGAVVDALDEDPPVGVGDEDDRSGPEGGARGPVLRRGHPGARPSGVVGQLGHGHSVHRGWVHRLCNSGRGRRVTAGPGWSGPPALHHPPYLPGLLIARLCRS